MFSILKCRLRQGFPWPGCKKKRKKRLTYYLQPDLIFYLDGPIFEPLLHIYFFIPDASGAASLD